ncbi:hypothetical protein [Brevibacillus laterosporus]|uniref:Uncharacterized protein n=1 Tax=Brevibacillus laterosporus TaxID=1465 RepID=A0AAP3GBC5_BRELA|nr:hypothetical protein [Brevibacillus laterosporus]MCR8979635.1 hypothetical protein [Brevibacillus laterosporus]MCZ0806790.1 hypothetical protein [Brevibacillus laterosporus]MCZ0825686.1 hypothetical protein [Brevibacillus laterosporus]MCZ0849464.1 hypothetical protein [Brevibacillus laterosporus]
MKAKNIIELLLTNVVNLLGCEVQVTIRLSMADSFLGNVRFGGLHYCCESSMVFLLLLTIRSGKVVRVIKRYYPEALNKEEIGEVGE